MAPMTTTVQEAPATPATSLVRRHTLLNHTVGILPVPGDLRPTDKRLATARVMVVENFNGIRFLIATDEEVCGEVMPALLAGVERYAHKHNAVAAPASWPTCGWCANTWDLCPERERHDMWFASSETRLLSLAA